MGRANTATDFWARTERVGECLEWQGRMLPPKARAALKGYGLVRWQGKRQMAHRVSWQIVNGPIPEGLHVCHHCDNPPCVDPEHLFLGTNAENQLDRAMKNRIGRPKARLTSRAEKWLGTWGMTPRGQKLTILDVREIRALLASGHSKKGLARRFCVSPKMIIKISRRESWANVD